MADDAQRLLIRSPLSQECVFELWASHYPTSEEWDALEEYIAVCRRGADRLTATAGRAPAGPLEPEE